MASENPHSSSPDDSGLRFGMMFAEIWHEWFAAMSEVAYHTHRVCELLTENGGALERQFGAFDFRSSRNRTERPKVSVDMDQLQDCLRSLDRMQAAQVLHAVQTMQAMDAMLKRKGSRAKESEEDAW